MRDGREKGAGMRDQGPPPSKACDTKTVDLPDGINPNKYCLVLSMNLGAQEN